MNDGELTAMGAVLAAIEPLDADARSRVLTWVTQKLNVVAPKGLPGTATRNQSASPSDFEEFHRLFDNCRPQTDIDRALVGGYWFQVCRTKDDFTGQEVNDELKQLGHPVGNITRAYDNLQLHNPVLARQVQKTGKKKQGRKRYKLTREGISRVEQMMLVGYEQKAA
ncbi:MAG: hypothetical protein K8H87_02710 [Pseudorhodoplanes sp.]|nr:hypothetical protein [Pseudorhodoplanes sp.]